MLYNILAIIIQSLLEQMTTLRVPDIYFHLSYSLRRAFFMNLNSKLLTDLTMDALYLSGLIVPTDIVRDGITQLKKQNLISTDPNMPCYYLRITCAYSSGLRSWLKSRSKESGKKPTAIKCSNDTEEIRRQISLLSLKMPASYLVSCWT